MEYAQALDIQRERYTMENLRIVYWDSQMHHRRVAIPDFYIEGKNLIVEIKSNYTLDIQNLKDKVKEYLKLGYNFKLMLEREEVDLNSL